MNMRINKSMRQGLGFINHFHPNTVAGNIRDQQERQQNAGKYVLNDFMASPEIFEIVGVSVEGMNGGTVIKLRSLRRGEVLSVDSFKSIRPARSNEIQANARQGSDQFDYHWQNQNQNFYY